jgi:hypothetical protein
MAMINAEGALQHAGGNAVAGIFLVGQVADLPQPHLLVDPEV